MTSISYLFLPVSAPIFANLHETVLLPVAGPYLRTVIDNEIKSFTYTILFARYILIFLHILSLPVSPASSDSNADCSRSAFPDGTPRSGLSAGNRDAKEIPHNKGQVPYYRNKSGGS